MTRWEHACVNMRADGAQAWGSMKIRAEEISEENLTDHDARDRAVAKLGAQGFELVMVTEEAENSDGVAGESMWFNRRVE